MLFLVETFASSAVADEGGTLAPPSPAPGAHVETPGNELDDEIPPAPTGSIPPPSPRGHRPEGFDAVAADVSGSGEGVRMSSRIATRLRVLHNDLGALASHGGGSVLDGVLSLVTGGLVVGLGVAANDDLVSPYFYVYGGATMARGVVELAVVPDPSDAAILFNHMPMDSEADVQARLRFGETSLEGLSDSMRLARLFDAGINIATGLAVIPVYLGPNDYQITNPMDWFVLIGSGFAILSGIVGLLSETDAERRWHAYEILRARPTPRQ